MLTSFQIKLAAGVAVALMAYGVYVAIRHDAVADLKQTIERQNNEAANKADDAVLDYEHCRDAGRMWNFGAGRCAGPAPGRGR